MLTYQNPRYLFRRHEIMKLVRKATDFLEIGPGDLALAQELLARFATGTLLDFNTTAVQTIYDELSADRKARLKLIIADFAEYHGFDSKFDCVVACEVIEHIQDDRAFLRKACQVLDDGGQLLLSVPARQKYWSTDDEIVGHYRRYERKELHEKLSEAGYTDIVIVSYGFPFENLVRLLRVALAKIQYRRKQAWDLKKRSQESAFMIRRGPLVNWIGLFVNKYTMYPFNLFASLFNGTDLAEGYIASAIKSTAPPYSASA